MKYNEQESCMRTLWYKGYSLYRKNRTGWGVYYKKVDFLTSVCIMDEETAEVVLFVLKHWQHLRSADLWNNGLLSEGEDMWAGFSPTFFEKARPLQVILDARANEKHEREKKRKPQLIA